MERALEGIALKSWEEVFLLKTSELSACPLWACTYTMSFRGLCKGQCVGITGENFSRMSFIKDIIKRLYRAVLKLDIHRFRVIVKYLIIEFVIRSMESEEIE